jgi:hypothetical protein
MSDLPETADVIIVGGGSAGAVLRGQPRRPTGHQSLYRASQGRPPLLQEGVSADHRN